MSRRGKARTYEGTTSAQSRNAGPRSPRSSTRSSRRRSSATSTLQRTSARPRSPMRAAKCSPARSREVIVSERERARARRQDGTARELTEGQPRRDRSIDVVISMKLSGASAADRSCRRLTRTRFGEAEVDASCDRHHESVFALTPICAANRANESPLCFNCATRAVHSSRVARPIAASASKSYASDAPASGTRFAERIRSSATSTLQRTSARPRSPMRAAKCSFRAIS
jgi:hypothetical protein